MLRAGSSRVLALVVAFALAVVVLPGSASAQSDEQAMRDARARVARIASQLEQAKTARAGADLLLAEANAQLAAMEAVVNDVAQTLDRQELAVAAAQQQLDELREAEVSSRHALSQRAASLYKRSGLPVQAIITAGDIGEALDRQSFLRVVSLTDSAGLERVVQGQKAVAAQQLRLDAEFERLAAYQAEQQEVLAQIEKLRNDRALAAASARSKVSQLSSQHEMMEKDQSRLADLIRRKQSTPAAASMPSTAGYIWPKCGRVTSEYGRRWGRLHAGLDVDGNTGDPIGASKDGRVIHAGNQGGYGKLVLVDHGDGVVTAYAHLSQITVNDGQSIIRGQRVGLMGSTGNSTGSHLHFETRVNGSAVNPRRFLPPSC